MPLMWPSASVAISAPSRRRDSLPSTDSSGASSMTVSEPPSRATTSLTDAEFKSFAVEFYNFARFFPKILVSQLVNTEDEAVAEEILRTPANSK